ncbi:tetrahydrofolate synthase, partial [Tilletia horrida]
MASASAPAGTAALIDGTAIAAGIRKDIGERIAGAVSADDKQRSPHLSIVQVGENPASSTYIRMKKLAAEQCKIRHTHVQLPANAPEHAIIARVTQLNLDPDVAGILVQLPLGSHINAEGERRVTEAISSAKDVDGFHALNIGHCSSKATNPLFVPCTPAGVIKFLKVVDLTNLADKHVVVLGRSEIVGNPTTSLLRARNATVTQCHSKTPHDDLLAKLATADIVVAAIGQPQFIKGECLKKDAIVIDVSTKYIPDASKRSGQRLVGDVDSESASRVASVIAPVSGGVGPMTVALLMHNVFPSAE